MRFIGRFIVHDVTSRNARDLASEIAAMIERRKDRSARYATRISFLRATWRSDKQMREYRGFKQKCFVVVIGNRHENIIDEYRDSEARYLSEIRWNFCE